MIKELIFISEPETAISQSFNSEGKKNCIEEKEGVETDSLGRSWPYIQRKCRKNFEPSGDPKRTVRNGLCDMNYSIRRALKNSPSDNKAYILSGKLEHAHPRDILSEK